MLLVAAAWIASSLVAPFALSREVSAPAVTTTCEPVARRGRVRCETIARVDAGEEVRWGEVVITGLPPFATALRGRIGPHDATVREKTMWRWEFAVVAREAGRGELMARARMVVCEGDRCAPRTVETRATIAVTP